MNPEDGIPSSQSLIFQLVSQLCLQQAVMLLCQASSFRLVRFFDRTSGSHSDLPTLSSVNRVLWSVTILHGILCQLTL